MIMERSNSGKKPVLVLGRAGLDLYADPPGTKIEDAWQFFASLGGSAANIAAAMSRLGSEVSLVTCVSDDAVGRFTLKQLQSYAIRIEHVAIVSGESRNSLAVVESMASDCQSVIYRNGASDFCLSEEHINGISFNEFSKLIVTGTSLAQEPSRGATLLAMRRARAAGIEIIFDVDYRPYSWDNQQQAGAVCRHAVEASDIVIGNDVEFDVVAGGHGGGDLAELIGRRNGVVAVYKMGEKGSVTFGHGRVFQTGVFPVRLLKPTGAGDAFMGGFVTGIMNGLDLEAAVKRGTAAAAIVVTRVGCAPAMPDEAELQQFMSLNKLTR